MSEPDIDARRAAFVSYAAADRSSADALTAYLEQRGIPCWIAPRDVPAGALYAEAIVRAINEAPALVLLLSRDAIGSSHVSKELERASSKNKQIIAVRLDDAPLTPAFEYFLSESQWVDIPAEGRESAFARVTEALKKLTGSRTQPLTPPASRPTAAAPHRPSSRKMWGAAFTFAAALAAAGVYFLSAPYRGGHYLRGTHGEPATVAAVDKSIAVLPFTDMSQAHDQEFFADGMAEQILDVLAKIPSLKVIARTSSFQFKGKSEDARVVGEKLGVATLLEGSVRKSGERLRVTAQLIRTSDGSHLWSEVYDREVRDVFRTQDEIADAVVSALKVSLLGASEGHVVATANTDAYALYLRSLASSRGFSKAQQDTALEEVQQALAMDPSFAPGWALLASIYSTAMVFGAPDSFEKVSARITEAANHALALDPKLAGVHVTLADNSFFVSYDFASAQRELARALELEPQNVDALSLSAYLAISECHLDEAEGSARKLIERDPLSVQSYRALATALWFQGRLSESEAVYRRVIGLFPTAESIHWRLALVLLSAGRPQDALAASDAEPARGWRDYGMVISLDALGRRAEADSMLAKTIADPLTRTSAAYQVSQIYAQRGDRDRAFEWLDKARTNRDPGYVAYFKCDPMLAPLRNDPRYKAMLAQLNLPP